MVAFRTPLPQASRLVTVKVAERSDWWGGLCMPDSGADVAFTKSLGCNRKLACDCEDSMRPYSSNWAATSLAVLFLADAMLSGQ
jgi:hypothetical protein